jgi:hypothetical protein
MSEEQKVLTKEVAEQYIKDSRSSNLNEFTSVEPAAAEVLSKKAGYLDLSGLRNITPEVVDLLASHCGGVCLDGIHEISEPVAVSLAKYAGGFLSLNGLTSLSDKSATALALQKGLLSLQGITDLSDEACAQLTKRFGFLSVSGSAVSKYISCCTEKLRAFVAKVNGLSDEETLSLLRAPFPDASSKCKLCDAIRAGPSTCRVIMKADGLESFLDKTPPCWLMPSQNLGFDRGVIPDCLEADCIAGYQTFLLDFLDLFAKQGKTASFDYLLAKAKELEPANINIAVGDCGYLPTEEAYAWTRICKFYELEVAEDWGTGLEILNHVPADVVAEVKSGKSTEWLVQNDENGDECFARPRLKMPIAGEYSLRVGVLEFGNFAGEQKLFFWNKERNPEAVPPLIISDADETPLATDYDDNLIPVAEYGDRPRDGRCTLDYPIHHAFN